MDEVLRGVLAMTQPGMEFVINSALRGKNRRIEIRAIVDGCQYVYRYYSRKYGWVYAVIDTDEFAELWSSGRIAGVD